MTEIKTDRKLNVRNFLQVMYSVFFSVVLDEKFKEKLGGVEAKGSEKEPTESNAGTDNEKVDKLENKDTNVPPETDQLEQTKTKDVFTRTIEEMKVSCLLVISHFPKVISRRFKINNLYME